MRIPATGEDILSLAVKAGQYALMKGNIDPKEIDAVFLGTETMTFAVKSVSNIICDLLGTSPNSVTQDVYNACAGETLAVLNAIGLIKNGIINKALIIGADICSYQLRSAGEPTQGAAAAAVIISKNPRIAVFGKKYGKYSANINDFYRLPNEKYPVVFGKYSVESYIKFQMAAFDDFYNSAGMILPDYMVFHSPFAKLPLKNFQNLLLNRWEMLKKILFEKSVEKNESVKIQEEAIDYLNDLLKPVLEKIIPEENLTETEELKQQLIQSLKYRVLPALNVPMTIGNMYSASIWSQLVYMLETVVSSNNLIYFGSYGSGATCISGMLKVIPGFKKIVENPPTVNDFFQYKIRKSISDYEDQRKEIDQQEAFYARIEPHHSNLNFFVDMNICDENCVDSRADGLGFCPSGFKRPDKKKLPMYAVVTHVPTQFVEEKDYFDGSIVRVSVDAKKDQVVEYNLLRAGKHETAPCIKSGFINWIPTYKPVIYPID
jgi:3-hydroxy-3-methylglutaryl CoA synthase